jgi:predicted transcriptional regulator
MVTKGFRLEQLFGSRTRARLLGLFLENPEKSYYVRDLTRRVDAQINAVRRELKNLVDLGLVLEVEGAAAKAAGEESEGRRFYKANEAFPLAEDLRRVMRRAAVLMNETLVEGVAVAGELNRIILTGRFMDLTNIPTDIIIVANADAEKVTAAVKNFERDIGREVNYTLLPIEEYTYRVDIGDRFIAAILAAKHVLLYEKQGESV